MNQWAGGQFHFGVWPDGWRCDGQDWAKARLEKSPRHLEWVKVKNGDRVVNCFIAYPQAKDPATAVLVIHERLGLTDWVREVADQLAEAGYALAFLSAAFAYLCR